MQNPINIIKKDIDWIRTENIKEHWNAVKDDSVIGEIDYVFQIFKGVLDEKVYKLTFTDKHIIQELMIEDGQPAEAVKETEPITGLLMVNKPSFQYYLGRGAVIYNSGKFSDGKSTPESIFLSYNYADVSAVKIGVYPKPGIINKTIHPPLFNGLTYTVLDIDIHFPFANFFSPGVFAEACKLIQKTPLSSKLKIE